MATGTSSRAFRLLARGEGAYLRNRIALTSIAILSHVPGSFSLFRTMPFPRDRFLALSSLAGLGLAGMLVHHSWLTMTPLSAGDWGWVGPHQAASWFPWPPVWDATSGFGTKNFAGLPAYPIFAVIAALMQLGLPWGLVEKVLFFWPFAILVFVSPWLLARHILADARWAVLSAVLFAGNTYMLVLGTAHLTIGMADVLAPLILLTFLLAIQRLSVLWSIGAGLLLGIQSVYELRVTYLTVLLAMLFCLVAVVMDLHPKRVLPRVGLAALTLAVYVGTQMHWLLPFFTYRGDHDLPIASSPWLAFMSLAHGMTGVHPFWTGNEPTIFRTTGLNPIYFILPLIAFLPLLGRRIRPEVVWLCLAALVAAFLIKQDNPPAGQIYDWMFAHIPGWNFFREASKLFVIVALAYSILVPIGLRVLINSDVTHSAVRRAQRGLGVALMFVVALLAAVALIPLERGQLGYATLPTGEPATFASLSRLLDSDHSYGRVLWFGGPVVGSSLDFHSFPLQSVRHPLVPLNGTADVGDPFASFCYTPGLAYCYLDKGLFTYLLSRSSVGYVVAPLGARVGSLPEGVTRDALLQSLTGILGAPEIIGSGGEALAVWQSHTAARLAVRTPAIALVEGGPGITPDVLPALNALGVPAVYRYSISARPVTDNVPSAIQVLPRVDGGCRTTWAEDVAVFARLSGSRLGVSLGDRSEILPRIGTSERSPGWGLYGLIALGSGFTAIDPTQGVELGPCIAWSPLTASVLDQQQPEQALGIRSASFERLSVSPGGSGAWIEIRQAYDPGWLLAGADVHLRGDSLFNLYSLSPSNPKSLSRNEPLQLSFSTIPSERYGELTAFSVLLVALVALALLARTRTGPPVHPANRSRPGLISTGARDFAAAGLTLLALAAFSETLAWWGVPSRIPATSLVSDPYAAGTIFLAASMALLLASVISHLLEASIWVRFRFRQSGRIAS